MVEGLASESTGAPPPPPVLTPTAPFPSPAFLENFSFKHELLQYSHQTGACTHTKICSATTDGDTSLLLPLLPLPAPVIKKASGTTFPIHMREGGWRNKRGRNDFFFLSLVGISKREAEQVPPPLFRMYGVPPPSSLFEVNERYKIAKEREEGEVWVGKVTFYERAPFSLSTLSYTTFPRKPQVMVFQ